ncbi:putative serine carboxypeptidase (CBP1) [Leptomonas pyrrhocoris]|uniref:Carboxypeptidase n=1 Tax=Leptomonas pyrrhocoris TaxID=157538 RepID=A0A0M9FYG9_LEPPY|nr:putative serine carboxypeptidase (CBP1) [Leptomonas pyrrhocoris]XP_015656949.1 putative serine carboxypeptidase (CBP1) [Leptomonas pyrrhocoris]KPA78509.1 putative serine carboxypeptidase (CBP1) [Leptomonas pyrrhocoris]KPA78510.1 putative serine carboxypeptidase (CBP1) [Leptomonas pyrrhocoris]|eukprot:XP_015656948.1 putative serine carboxypeptidase (CBP1) [Leptomonas pyrrhocoris]
MLSSHPTRFTLVLITIVACTFAAIAVFAAPAHHGYAACDPSVVQSSGYIDIPGVSGTQKHYFYWLFGPRRWPTDGSQPPVIMWMTGGPGCSSSLALLSELGPCMMNETSGELHRNAYGWNDEAYLLFVDQPTGVGYSYGDKANYVHNESEVAEDMYHFLQGFARKFTSPSITGANDFFIIGESYAGHYVPAVSYRIFQGNQRGDGPVINLKGIGIGNGITDPYTQYPSYAETAYHWCKEKLGAPCITDAAYEEMLSLLPACLNKTWACNMGPDDTDESCSVANALCSEYKGYYFATGRNSYDIRKTCDGPLCYPMGYTLGFYTDPVVRASLGINDAANWSTCNSEVGELFDRDHQRNFNYTFPPMLAAGIRVLIYAGDMDYTCNWIGNKAWVKALEWSDTAAFNAAPDLEFAVGGRWAGQERKYGNFSFVRVYDAGHMVPMDQPEVSLYMVSQFLHDKRLA